MMGQCLGPGRLELIRCCRGIGGGLAFPDQTERAMGAGGLAAGVRSPGLALLSKPFTP